MSERAPYSRVYWSIVDDPKFEDVYDNDGALATWLRLLIVADQAWPASAHVPSSAKRRHIELLSRVGLIDMQTGSRYRVHGLDGERNRRKEAATRGGSATPSGTQAGPKRDPSASRTTGLSRDEPSQAETSLARTGLVHVTPQVMAAWSAASGTTLLGSGEFAQNRIDDSCRRHDEQAVVNAIRRARTTFDHVPDTAVLAMAVRNILDPLPDRAATKAVEAEERESARSRRGVENTKRRIHDMGAHAEEADPSCPSCQAVVA